MRGRRIPARLDRFVRRRARDRCEYCGLPQDLQEARFHVDHIRPRVSGGETSAANLALACVSCSPRKGARAFARDPATGARAVLFDPRTDKWTEHFSFDRRLHVIGKTATGRATVSALLMNRPVAVGIRAALLALGRLPVRRRSE